MHPHRLPPDPEIPAAIERFARGVLDRATAPSSRVTFTFPAGSTTYRVRHRLPKVPGNFRVVDKTAACDIYRDSTKRFDRFYAYLRSDTAGVTVSIDFS